MIQMEEDFPKKPSRGRRWQRSRRARSRRKFTKLVLFRKSLKVEKELIELMARQIRRESIKKRRKNARS